MAFNTVAIDFWDRVFFIQRFIQTNLLSLKNNQSFANGLMKVLKKGPDTQNLTDGQAYVDDLLWQVAVLKTGTVLPVLISVTLRKPPVGPSKAISS